MEARMDIITTDERLLEHLKNKFPQYTFTHKFIDIAKEAIRAWEEYDPLREIELPDFMTSYNVPNSVNDEVKAGNTAPAKDIIRFLNLNKFLSNEATDTIQDMLENGEIKQPNLE
jgi:disulfide oxidoreductase YuzD